MKESVNISLQITGDNFPSCPPARRVLVVGTVNRQTGRKRNLPASVALISSSDPVTDLDVHQEVGKWGSRLVWKVGSEMNLPPRSEENPLQLRLPVSLSLLAMAGIVKCFS